MERSNQFVLEDIPNDQAGLIAQGPSHKPKQSKTTAHYWHLRVGHPGPEALNRLVNNSTGARIQGPTTVECNDCGMTKLTRQISRAPRYHDEGPGLRIAVDFTHLNPDAEGFDSLMLFTDRWSGYIWEFYLQNRTQKNLCIAFTSFLTYLERQYQVKPRTFECDNEIKLIKRAVALMLEEQGISIEASAPDTQAQNGGAERSGGIIESKSRAMRQGAHLPEDLWREVYGAAIYLHNRMPKYTFNWKSPYDRLHTFFAHRDGIVVTDRKPQQGHLRVYGCKAFAMTTTAQRKSQRIHKLDPRAFIGYLVGYQSTNIYRIWNPLLNKVISTRDVIFNEDEVFPGSIEELKDDFLRVKRSEITALLEGLEEPELEPESRGEHSDDPIPPIFEDDDAYAVESRDIDGGEAEQDNKAKDSADGDANGPESLYPTPRMSPLAALFSKCITEIPDYPLTPMADDFDDFDSPERKESSFLQAAFAAGRLVAPIGKYEGKTIDRARLHRLLRQPPRRANTQERVHSRELPPPPRHHGELPKHPLGELFLMAEKTHLQSHEEMNSWIEVLKEEARGHQILDCMWVYTYKFDKAGFFIKCKARLVVRGDQQIIGSMEETYASTLAGRSFRTLMAIAARFDLELMQFDAVNAFVNAPLEREVYMKMPPGSRKPGKILMLKKALYGLRESPLLWQKELRGTLQGLGFDIIPHEPCCMISNGIILFYYVDDLVLAFREAKRQLVIQLIEQLQSHYVLTGGHELQWFLGIEIIRDRQNKLIWLSQSQFALKIANLVTHLDAGANSQTPMRKNELLPYQGKAKIFEIRNYQRKIGSILYLAVITRPDVAFAASRLSRFGQNPGPEHHEAADRTLLYIKNSHALALQLGGGDDFVVASDASFADNSLDRKSSQAYIMKLFGGVVGWRANKQTTVTLSTTEAELLALSQAAKEGIFISRLLQELGVTVPKSSKVIIQCDNQQTIKLVNKELGQLHTRLRHVDIHNHWLRQEAENGTIAVEYTPTTNMLADGLTKALNNLAFRDFVQQLGLIDVSEQLVNIKELEDISEAMEKFTITLE